MLCRVGSLKLAIGAAFRLIAVISEVLIPLRLFGAMQSTANVDGEGLLCARFQVALPGSRAMKAIPLKCIGSKF